MGLKVWIDDIRFKPDEYDYHAYTVMECISLIKLCIDQGIEIELLDFDHDAGEEYIYGGDYIEILKWMEQVEEKDGIDFSSISFKFHTGNPVGLQNMRLILKARGWTELVEPWDMQ